MIDAIFIVGTGRSGTHFLCRSLLGFSNVTDLLNGKEDPTLLDYVAKAAIHHKDISDDGIELYKNRINQSKNKIFIDQHHPTIHNITQLESHFPNSIFLGIDRPTEQIVASMLEHKGVQKWFKYARKNDIPFPNNFLGIDSLDELKETPQHMLCTKRIVAHKKLNQLLSNNPNFKLINFENFVIDKIKELTRVLGDDIQLLGNYTEVEVSNLRVLEKYKTVLTSKKIQEIQQYSNLNFTP